ncbi:glycoside hydrolase family 3 N-terminal domain-containing protein, partial [Brachybacterium hainanense]
TAPASDTGGASGEPAPPETTPPPTLAEQTLAAMGTRERAAQLVLAGVRAGDPFPTDDVAGLGLGGFFLLGRWEQVPDVVAAVSAARDASGGAPAPLLAVDQEGGQIRMLRGDAARRTESAAELGEQGPDAVAEAYRSIAEDLSALGLHVDLAPVADVVDPGLGRDNAPVGKLERGFGTDPEEVSAAVAAAVGALHEVGVAATLKHFPGLGRIRGNTDFSTEDVTDDVTAPGDAFLAPFSAGIAAGAELVMTSSAVYTQIDADAPAMFSPAVVQDLLRGELGFEGIVMTDDIGSAKAVADVPVPERATRALEAGGDLVITADPAIAGELVEAIEAWAGGSSEADEALARSALRMLALKERFGLLG